LWEPREEDGEEMPEPRRNGSSPRSLVNMPLAFPGEARPPRGGEDKDEDEDEDERPRKLGLGLVLGLVLEARVPFRPPRGAESGVAEPVPLRDADDSRWLGEARGKVAAGAASLSTASTLSSASRIKALSAVVLI
jgi:hypothetical protein